MHSIWKIGGLLALAIVASSTANAAKERILYNFQGNPDGGGPLAPLMRDAAGNLYGTTQLGGAYFDGTAFQITPKGKEIILHSFFGPDDGRSPEAGLVPDAFGNLYGTAPMGGKANCGTVFELTPDHQEKIIHTFRCNEDGDYPGAGVIVDGTGNLYGTTVRGGGVNCGQESGCGTLFKITASGRKKLLHAFAGGSDGIYPYAPLIRDPGGNLYGTTQEGGGSCDGDSNNCGVVFKLTPDGRETIVHAFGGPPSDGYFPAGGLISDEAGNLYGLTLYGGTDDSGTVYKLSPDGQETVLHSFRNPSPTPWGELVRDDAGDLFGVMYDGGTAGEGAVFKLTPEGKEVILHSFSQQDGDGEGPLAGPILDDAGNLYGTTVGGGTGIDRPGTVFRIRSRR